MVPNRLKVNGDHHTVLVLIVCGGADPSVGRSAHIRSAAVSVPGSASEPVAVGSDGNQEQRQRSALGTSDRQTRLHGHAESHAPRLTTAAEP